MSPMTVLVSRFSEAEAQLLAAAEAEGLALDWLTFERNFAPLSASASTALKLQQLSDPEQRAIFASVKRIQAIVTLFRNLQLSTQQQITELTKTTSVLQHYHRAHDVSSGRSKDALPPSSPSDPSKLDYFPCVEWFVTHFASPYPSSADKASLAARVGVEPLSIERWFTNYRRRSGWSQVMKTFAGNNKNQMRTLVETVLDPHRSHKVQQDAKDAIAKAQSYLSQKTDVAPIILEAIAMKPMTPDELENYQKSRRARQQKVASLVKAAREKASPKNPVSAGKRKRHDENVNSDDVRPSKRSHLAAPYPASSTPSPTYSPSPKRQREPSDDASGEPASKKARSTRDDVRVVYDADGRAHYQRRKTKSRSTPMPTPTSPSSISTLSLTNPNSSASKVQKRKSQTSLDADESLSPSPPPAHKRRKLTSSAVARSASLNESTVLANSKQKKSSKDKKPRAGSAPVTSPPTAFLGPNQDAATEVRTVTNQQAPSTTIIHPPLTAKELDDILSGASMMSHPAKLPTPINTSTLSNMSISQLQDLVPTPSNTHFPVQFYPLIPSADQISSSDAQVSLDLSSIGSFEPPDNLDFNSLQGANILTNQIMSQAPSSMLTTGDVTQFVQNEDLSSFMVPSMLHTTYSSPQPSLSSSPSSSPTSSFCSSPTSSTPSSTSLVKHPFLPTAQPPVVVATDRKELIRRKLELLETQRKALQMEMELEELESASAAGSQSVSRDFESSIDLLSVM